MRDGSIFIAIGAVLDKIKQAISRAWRRRPLRFTAKEKRVIAEARRLAGLK
jgi:hypothetical protein